MAELNQVMEALRRADAAGNKEDATRLAAIAQRMKQAPQPESTGMMPFVNRAIAGTLGAPADVIRGGINLIPGIDMAEPFMGRKSIERGMGSIGIPLPEEGQQPKTIPEHIGRGVGEVASLMIPGGAGVKALAKGTGLTSKITSNIWKSMIKHPALTMTSEAAGGAGAGLGRGIAEKEYPESPWKKQTAEIAGGVAGSMAPTMFIHGPSMIALRGGKTLLRKVSMPFTKKGAEYRSGEFIKGLVPDPEKTGRIVAERTISDLPPSVAAGEKKLVALYKGLSAQDPAVNAETIETLSNSIVKLEKEMRKLGYGSPELLAEIVQKRIAALELRMDKRVLAAVGKAEKKLNALPMALRKVNESNIVRNEIESVMKQEQVKVRALWEKVPKDIEVGVKETKKAYSLIKKDLAEAQKVDIPLALKKTHIIHGKPKVEEPLLILPAKYQKIVPPTEVPLKEMQGLRSKLLESARKARKEGQWNKARIANDMADAILKDLDVASPETGSLKVALAATRKFKERFETGIVGKMLGYSKSGAKAIPPELTLDVSVGRMRQKGSIDIGKIAVTPEATAATERYLARGYTDYAMDLKTGSINPVKSEKWLRDNQAILDQFPSLQKQLSDAGSAQKLAGQTSVAMEARKKALRDPKISVAARFLKSNDMNMTVESVLKSDNPKYMATELVKQAGKDKTGKALHGFRGSFVDYVLEKSSIGAFNELGEQTLSGRTLLNFINKNESTLSKVFTPEQITRMRTVGSELAKIETFEKATAGKPDIEMKDAASSALKLFSRIGGAQVGRQIAGATGGGTVQTPGIVSEKFKGFATFISKDKTLELIHDAVLSKDPKLLQSLLLPIDKPTSRAGRENLRILNRTMNLWLAGTGQRVMDNIIKENQKTRSVNK